MSHSSDPAAPSSPMCVLSSSSIPIPSSSEESSSSVPHSVS